MRREEINFNLFLLALIITSPTISVFAQDQSAINAQAYAVVQKCGQREYVDPVFCSLQKPPINCVLPQFCYTATGQESDLKCQQLPDDCFQKVLQARGGGGGATGGSTPVGTNTSPPASSIITTASTPARTAASATPPPNTPGSTFSTTSRPPTPPPTVAGFPTQAPPSSRDQASTPGPGSGPGAFQPKNLVVLFGYDSELGPPSIPTSLGSNFQQNAINQQQNFQGFPQPSPPFQSQQSKGFQQQQSGNYQQPQNSGFQQAPVPPQPQYLQPPPQPQSPYKGFQGRLQRRSVCSDSSDTCSLMANRAHCDQVGSWMWQNCPFACGRC